MADPETQEGETQHGAKDNRGLGFSRAYRRQMGNKGTKEQVDQLLQLTDGEKGMARSREELVGCLASIADMANTGHGSALPPGAAGKGRAPPAPPEAMLKMNSKLRRRLESLKGTGDDLEMIENLMGLEDNGADWEHMRSWMVWCMHANLDESSDDSPPASANRRHLRRQPSMDVVKSKLETQQNFDVNPRDERMSAQSSLESNAET